MSDFFVRKLGHQPGTVYCCRSRIFYEDFTYHFALDISCASVTPTGKPGEGDGKEEGDRGFFAQDKQGEAAGRTAPKGN